MSSLSVVVVGLAKQISMVMCSEAWLWVFKDGYGRLIMVMCG